MMQILEDSSYLIMTDSDFPTCVMSRRDSLYHTVSFRKDQMKFVFNYVTNG